MLDSVSHDDLSRFVDHPAILYYLCGKSASSSVAEARRDEIRDVSSSYLPEVEDEE